MWTDLEKAVRHKEFLALSLAIIDIHLVVMVSLIKSCSDQKVANQQRLSVSFSYTGHPQPDFIRKSETLASYAQSKYGSDLAVAVRTGAFTSKEMVTMESFTLSQVAGVDTAPSAFTRQNTAAALSTLQRRRRVTHLL